MPLSESPIPSTQHTDTLPHKCPSIKERYFRVGGLLSALQLALYMHWQSYWVVYIRSPFLSIITKSLNDLFNYFLSLNEMIKTVHSQEIQNHIHELQGFTDKFCIINVLCAFKNKNQSRVSYFYRLQLILKPRR
jgi:hypothetical protein